MSCKTQRDGNLLVYVGDCPACGREIKHPFARGSMSPYTHNTRASRRECDLVVLADPSGEDHIVEIVGPNESYEDVMRRHSDLYLGRFKQSVHLEAACEAAELAA